MIKLFRLSLSMADSLCIGNYDKYRVSCFERNKIKCKMKQKKKQLTKLFKQNKTNFYKTKIIFVENKTNQN